MALLRGVRTQLSAEYDAGDDAENPVEHNDPATKRRNPAQPTDRQSAVRPEPKYERVFNLLMQKACE